MDSSGAPVRPLDALVVGSGTNGWRPPLFRRCEAGWRLPAAGPRSVSPAGTRILPVHDHATPSLLVESATVDVMPASAKNAPRGRAGAVGARATLAARLDEAAAALISVIAHIEPDRWRHIPAPGVWSIGKDAEHVIEAAGYHQWIVRLTIGQKVPSRRPVLERTQLTTDLSPQEAVALLRRRTEEGIELLLGLNGRSAQPAHSTAARPIPGARRDDRAGPDRSLRHPSRRHRGEAPDAFGCSWDRAVGNRVVPPRQTLLGL